MTTKLSEVEVHTLGLVEQGANQEKFFLMKSAKVDETIVDRIVSAVRKAVESVFVAPQVAEPKEVTKDMAEKEEVKTEVSTEKEAAPVVEEAKKEEVAEVKVEAKVEEVKSVEEPKVEEVKTETAKADNGFTELEKKLADQQALIDEMRAQIAKTNERAENAEEAVIEKTYLEKAEQFSSLPVAKEELAKHLRNIAKADAESVKFFEGLLLAANNIAKDSELFKEFGTTREPEDVAITKKVEGLVKDAGGFREALLNLPIDEQQAYLNKLAAKIQKK